VIQRIDRAVSFRGRQLLFAGHRDLDGRLRQTGIVFLTRRNHAEGFQIERRDKFADGFLDQQRKRTVRGVKLKSAVFHELDFMHDLFGNGVVFLQINAQFFRFIFHVAFSRQVGHQHAPVIADEFRLNVFVGGRIFHHGADMNAAFVRERAAPDKRPGIQRRHIGHIADIMRQIRQLFDGFRRQTFFPHL